jgi:hypothetical protein
MSGRAANSVGLGLLLLFGGIALMSDPKCKCGCKTVAEHLITAGFNLLGGLGS